MLCEDGTEAQARGEEGLGDRAVDEVVEAEQLEEAESACRTRGNSLISWRWITISPWRMVAGERLAEDIGAEGQEGAERAGMPYCAEMA